MSYYELLLFLHVTAAVIWLGSALFDQAIMYREEQVGDRLFLRQFVGHSEWWAPRMFIPASLAVFVFGILLTIEGPWGFGDLWITLSLAGYGVSFLVGILYLAPESKRIQAAGETHGPDSTEARFYMRRLSVVGRMELAVLFLVVWMMTVKPTGEDLGALVVAGAVLAAALSWGVPKLRPNAREAPSAVAVD